MRLGAYPAVLRPGTHRAGGLRRPRSSTSATATATSSTPATAAGSRRRAALLGHLARRPPRRVRRAGPEPPVLGRHPGPPRVQEPARPSPPAVPGAGRAALARAEGRTPRLPLADDRGGLRRSPQLTHAERDVGLPPRRLHRIARGGFLTFCEETFESPTGERFVRWMVEHPGAVAAVPVDGRARRPGRAPVRRGARRPRPAARDPGRQARRPRARPPTTPWPGSWPRRSSMRAGRLVKLADVLELPGLLRRAHPRLHRPRPRPPATAPRPPKKRSRT